MAKVQQLDTLLRFHCVGCGRDHYVQCGAPDGPNWRWNDDVENPTLSPSILVTYNGSDAGVNGAPPAVCHSFIEGGRIRYLGDSTHALADQTVELPDLTSIQGS